MALIDIGGDTWQREYESAERLHRSVLAEVGERSRLQKSSVAFSQSTDNLRRMLGQLNQEVGQLRQHLGQISSSLTSGELGRRERLLDSLARKERQLRDAIISSDGARAVAKSRQQLVGGGLADLGTTGFGEAGGGGGGFGEAIGGFSRSEPDEGEATRGVSTQAIKQSQEEALAQQDAGLDMLHTIIVRQKGMAQQIGNEVNSQNELIDDIGDRMDGTNARLIDTTQNVRVVDRKDKTCGYWVVIVILFIAIIVVSVI